MRKMTLYSTALLALATCFSSTSYAQVAGSVEYYYAGPLDTISSNSSSRSPVAVDAAAISAQRVPVTRLTPPKNLREAHTGVSDTVVGPISDDAVFKVAQRNLGPASVPLVQSFAPPSPTQVPTIPSRITPIEVASPEFIEPSVEPQAFEPQAFSGQPISLMNLPPAQDPTRFGYRDGEAFGFDNSRLYNPLEGPQLNLQGAPTADFGDIGCDEWAGFCRGKNLVQNCGCGGLKTNPGHLGLPWLGSTDNCDQTIPLTRKRTCGCKECQAQCNCESSCGATNCSSCSGK